LESYRVYADGRVVYEDDFEEGNHELDLGGGDDYEEYSIPEEISEHIVDCCSTSNKIPVIPTAAEGFAEVFYNNKKIGEVSTMIQIMDIRAQIKEDPCYVNECFVRWVDEEGVKWDLYIDTEGYFEVLPKGFFDKFDILLDKIIGI
jgi:hypothetical protein